MTKWKFTERKARRDARHDDATNDSIREMGDCVTRAIARFSDTRHPLPRTRTRTRAQARAAKEKEKNIRKISFLDAIDRPSFFFLFFDIVSLARARTHVRTLAHLGFSFTPIRISYSTDKENGLASCLRLWIVTQPCAAPPSLSLPSRKEKETKKEKKERKKEGKKEDEEKEEKDKWT